MIQQDFSAEKDEQEYIMSLVWKVCCDSLAHIRNDVRLRGIYKGSVIVNNYADGVASIHFEKPIKAGGLLDWGKKKYCGGSSSSISNMWFFEN